MTWIEEPVFYSRSFPRFNHISLTCMFWFQRSRTLTGFRMMFTWLVSRPQSNYQEPGQPQFKNQGYIVFLHSWGSKTKWGQQLPRHCLYKITNFWWDVLIGRPEIASKPLELSCIIIPSGGCMGVHMRNCRV